MNEKIIDRLRKLMQHERSAREIGNIAEAEAFAAKIQQQLDAYNLAMSDIDIEAAKSTMGMEQTDYKVLFEWQKQLLIAIADVNGCMMVAHSGYARIVGTSLDRTIVDELYRYFEKLGIDLAQLSLKEYKGSGEYKRKRKKTRATHSYKGSFLIGFTLRLSRRLRDQHDETLAVANAASTALIYIGNKVAEARVHANSLMNLREVPAKRIASKTYRDPAFAAGLVAGDSIALTAKTLN